MNARQSLMATTTLLAACAHGEPGADTQAASAELRNGGGAVVATALAREADGVAVTVTANGVPPGVHGVHVHAVGRCDPPGFESAGAHWSPEGRQHGRLNPRGPHMGDLPNMTVGADGRGRIDFTIDGAMLRSGARAMLDADGAAIVIHAAADDERTDPSGNSGARIACGVLG